MSKKIFRAIFLVSFLVLVVGIFLAAGAFYAYFTNIAYQQLRIETNIIEQGLNGEGESFLPKLQQHGYRVTWIAADGQVLYESSRDPEGMENHLMREEVQEALASGYGESSRFSSTLSARSVYVAKRLADGSILRLSIAQFTIIGLLSGLLPTLLLVLLLTLLISRFLGKRIAQKIVRPLDELDLDHPLENEVDEEVVPLLRRISRQQKALVAEEEEREAFRREFSANVSHELKTPLHAISGYAELLKNGMTSPEQIKPFGQTIYDETQRTIKLVEDILRLSHLDEGEEHEERESADLAKLAREVTERFAAEARDKGITLHEEGELAPLTGIPTLLEAIISNLVENAVHYTPAGGEVWVSVKTEDDAVLLSVKDTGIGIAPADQERVFERFYRVDKSHSRETGGTGLGLSIVKHAAAIHHARIALQSALGQGTTISIRFPR